jgi:hypothetical protein
MGSGDSRAVFLRHMNTIARCAFRPFPACNDIEGIWVGYSLTG